jgi:hypothetical protein
MQAALARSFGRSRTKRKEYGGVRRRAKEPLADLGSDEGMARTRAILRGESTAGG